MLVAGCAHVSRQQDVLRQIATHQFIPEQAFINGRKLYLQYQIEGKAFALMGDLDQIRGNGTEQKILLSARREIPLRKNLPVHVVSHGFNELIKYTLLPLIPPVSGQGVLVFMDTYEMLLYRSKEGKPRLVFLKDAPGDIDIVGQISAEQFTALYYQELKKIQQSSGSEQTRFLLRLEEVPL